MEPNEGGQNPGRAVDLGPPNKLREPTPDEDEDEGDVLEARVMLLPCVLAPLKDFRLSLG